MKLCYDAGMQDLGTIWPPDGNGDRKGAQRVFEEFLVLYQPVFIRLEYYLEDVIDHAGVHYAEAYRPWQTALHDLFKGVYLITKNIPPNLDKLIDALHTFTFDSAIQFLEDLCTCCKLQLAKDWAARFKEHIKLLLFSLSILHRRHQPEWSR